MEFRAKIPTDTKRCRKDSPIETKKNNIRQNNNNKR